MKRIAILVLSVCASALMLISCEEDRGANPFDPNTPITADQKPKIESFSPVEGGPGTEVHILGSNFTTATAVTFGGKAAESFEILSDTEISAIVSQYGGTGAVAVTNAKGTRSLSGFMYIKPVVEDEPNKALGKLATASSENTPAANLTDGTDALWQAMSTGHEWAMVDLSKVVKLNRIVINWDPGASATAFDILISEDGENFSTLYSTTTYNALSDPNGGLFEYKFEETAMRYIKIDMTACINIWNYTIKEIEAYKDDSKPAAKVNLALGKAASCSSTIAGNIANLTDGTDALWQAGTADADWAMVDLGEAKTFNNVVITVDPGACPVEFEIQVSTDGENFTTAYKRSNYNPAYDGGICNIHFNDVEARYVKIDMTKCCNIWNFTIKEFEIYKEEAKTAANVNLALGKAASCSSTIAGNIANLTDGTDALWQAGTADADWAMVDLGENRKFDNVIVTVDPGACPVEYTLEASTDGENFTVIFSRSNYNPSYDGGINNMVFNEVEARYVKINMTKCCNIWNYTIKEMEVYKSNQ